jgi:hypothetical protein
MEHKDLVPNPIELKQKKLEIYFTEEANVKWGKITNHIPDDESMIQVLQEDNYDFSNEDGFNILKRDLNKSCKELLNQMVTSLKREGSNKVECYLLIYYIDYYLYYGERFLEVWGKVIKEDNNRIQLPSSLNARKNLSNDFLESLHLKDWR